MSNSPKKVLAALLACGLLLSCAACSSRAPEELDKVASKEEQTEIKKEEPSSQENPKPEGEKPQETAKDPEKSEESKQPESEQKLSDEEKQEYFSRYLEPYAHAGMMYDTWNMENKPKPERLINFYESNGLGPYLDKIQETDPKKLSDYETIGIPSETIDSYITSYFKVDREYLHQADNYNASDDTYLFSTMFGMGGGPAPVVERIEKNEAEHTLKITCIDVEGTEISATIQLEGQDKFYYIAGNQ